MKKTMNITVMAIITAIALFPIVITIYALTEDWGIVAKTLIIGAAGISFYRHEIKGVPYNEED